MSAKIIDTHIHVWNFEKAKYDWLRNDTSILNRTYDIEELDEQRRLVGVSEGILVQAANNFEDTDWMLRVAETTGWIKGVVGWLPLEDPVATAKALNNYTANNYFKGVRHLIHDEPDPKWLLQEKVIESLKIVAAHKLPYDIVGTVTAHIETALEVADRVPGLKMIFDHLNQPPISSKEKYGRWGELMAKAAKFENMYVKISGLGTCSKSERWTAEDLKPYVAFAFEEFGANRCMIGGDWPVSLLAGSYFQTWKVYKDLVDSLLNDEEAESVFYTNARNFYGLSE